MCSDLDGFQPGIQVLRCHAPGGAVERLIRVLGKSTHTQKKIDLEQDEIVLVQVENLPGNDPKTILILFQDNTVLDIKLKLSFIILDTI